MSLFILHFSVDEGTPLPVDDDAEYDIEHYGPLRVEFVEASSSSEAKKVVEDRCGTRKIRWGAIEVPNPLRVREMLARNAARGHGHGIAMLTMDAW